jgi:hypothetical protein
MAPHQNCFSKGRVVSSPHTRSRVGHFRSLSRLKFPILLEEFPCLQHETLRPIFAELPLLAITQYPERLNSTPLSKHIVRIKDISQLVAR